jgi:hypothetical protein
VREIKFRAWQIHNKVMLTGVHFDIIGNDLSKSAREMGCELMQFTGLKDKNGKEIYERDILQVEGYRLSVIWYSKGACFRYWDEGTLESPLNYHNPEVIGNLYESPELLRSNA